MTIETLTEQPINTIQNPPSPPILPTPKPDIMDWTSIPRPTDILKYYFEFVFYKENPSIAKIKFVDSPHDIYFTLPIINISSTCPQYNNTGELPYIIDKTKYVGTGNVDWEVYNQQLEDMRTGYTGLPFVPTDFPSIGGFSAEQINNKEYYPKHNKPDGWKGGTYEYDCCLSYFTGANTNSFVVTATAPTIR